MKDKYVVEIQVWLQEQNHPIVHQNAKSYQKGDLFCVYEPEKQVTFKYPISKIWRVREGYPNETREEMDK
jgi:hypothetical protein